MVDKTSLLETLLNLLASVTGMVVYIVIMIGAVLAVDFVVLLLLNLLWKLDTWIILLLCEGFILMFVGAAGWGQGEHRLGPIAGWKRPRIYHVILRPKRPGIWLSVAMAGAVLFGSSLYAISSFALPGETIYIRADGRVVPITGLIQRDGNIYTFTGNINALIEVQKDNIVIDGAGYTLQGTESGIGIYLKGRSNVIIRNMEIKAFKYGIYLTHSSNNTVSGNNITNNTWQGILLWVSSNNTIFGNNIKNNRYGIRMMDASRNIICHNNFVNNRAQTYVTGGNNNWDNGYPSGGNYWSNYERRYPKAKELDGSGIWNTPYVIDSGNQDKYPLTNPC